MCHVDHPDHNDYSRSHFQVLLIDQNSHFAILNSCIFILLRRIGSNLNSCLERCVGLVLILSKLKDTTPLVLDKANDILLIDIVDIKVQLS